MPKQVFKINAFHGGINSSTDPRDIDDKEVVDCVNLVVGDAGIVRTIGSNVSHDIPILDNTGASSSNLTGSGLFSFSHDRTGGEDAGSSEAETGDNYLALYDDNDAQVWIAKASTTADWDDDINSSTNGVIDFKGKGTSNVARPSFFSVDGALRVSSGEFAKYDSGTDINMGSHLLVTAVALTVDDGTAFAVGNYIQIDDEILFVSAIATNVLTVTRSMFGTKDAQHQDDADVYILNMNQWYGYLNNKLFQTSVGVSEYTTNKWYNEIQHLRSLDELGITLALNDSSSASPDATALVGDKIIVAHWLSKDGFWSGSYFLGMTPVYLGGQEGPISDVGTDTIQLNKEILNVQLFICHPTIASETISTHPLKDDRIIGLNLYTRSYTSDEWFLLKRFDLLEGGKHGWTQYNDAQTATGFWTDGDLGGGLANAAAQLDNFAGGGTINSHARSTVRTNVKAGTALGLGRRGILRISGFDTSPVYTTFDLNSTGAQTDTLTIVNPGPGTANFVLEVLDENYDILYTTQQTQAIEDSGFSPPDYPEDGGYIEELGGGS